MIEKPNDLKTAKKVRTDKKNNKAKVVKALLKDPTLTQREVARKTGLSLGNVNNKMNDIEQIKDNDTIDRICSNDRALIDLVAGMNLKEVTKVSEQETIELHDLKLINDITRESTKRYTLFKGDVTDKDGGLKLSSEQQDKINKLLELNN